MLGVLAPLHKNTHTKKRFVFVKKNLKFTENLKNGLDSYILLDGIVDST